MYVAQNDSKVIILLGKIIVYLFIENYAILPIWSGRLVDNNIQLLFYAIIFQNKFVIMHKLWHNL